MRKKKEEEIPAIRLTISTTDKSFNAEMLIPVDSAKEERDEAVKNWLGQLEFALKVQSRYAFAINKGESDE